MRSATITEWQSSNEASVPRATVRLLGGLAAWMFPEKQESTLVLQRRPYLPGQGPLPAPRRAPSLPPEMLADCPLLHEGVALYEAGYYWEAAAAWCALWKACPSTSPHADLFKGLTQLAGARLRAVEGCVEGAERLATSARVLLERAEAAGVASKFDWRAVA